MQTSKVINVDSSKTPMLEFGDYCAIGALAVKYSTLKCQQDEKKWDIERRKLIKRKKEKSWLETEISNEYAQFVVAQSLTETNFFEVAVEICYKALDINQKDAEELFKHHVLLDQA